MGRQPPGWTPAPGRRRRTTSRPRPGPAHPTRPADPDRDGRPRAGPGLRLAVQRDRPGRGELGGDRRAGDDAEPDRGRAPAGRAAEPGGRGHPAGQQAEHHERGRRPGAGDPGALSRPASSTARSGPGHGQVYGAVSDPTRSRSTRRTAGPRA
ncbi:hypothetical protein [Ornithinimicrobium kibberense]|uniref:hypothetical protein n=1 Tax=Ornithinimicrobium kibberense TaxID=282060 RepID=UPI003A8EAAA6